MMDETIPKLASSKEKLTLRNQESYCTQAWIVSCQKETEIVTNTQLPCYWRLSPDERKQEASCHLKMLYPEHSYSAIDKTFKLSYSKPLDIQGVHSA